LKINVFVQICSLCFVQQKSYNKKGENTGSPNDVFLAPPSAILSLLSLLRHQLRPLVKEAHDRRSKQEESSHDLEVLDSMAEKLYAFTKEMLWRIFIGLKDYFLFSRFSGNTYNAVDPSQRWYHQWATTIGAVMLTDKSECKILDEDSDFIKDLLTPEIWSDHAFQQFATPAEAPLSLAPAVFIPRMLSKPQVVLHRSLRMNDYRLSEQILKYWGEELEGSSFGKSQHQYSSGNNNIRSVDVLVAVAKKFAEFRQVIKSTPTVILGDSINRTQDFIETNLSDFLLECEDNALAKAAFPGRKLLAFYILVDLAVSAAPHSSVSTRLLRTGLQLLSEEEELSLQDSDSTDSDSNRWKKLRLSDKSITNRNSEDAQQRDFLRHWVERLNVLVEARTEYKTQSAAGSLANIILGIETLPSEPALLKSHLNRLHSQRHAIMSLVESVDLMKKGKGQNREQQNSLVDFLAGAIRKLTNSENESTDAEGIDLSAVRKQATLKSSNDESDKDEIADGDDSVDDDLLNVVNSLSSSKYLLRFLEYLAKVTDLIRSASGEDESSKLFDVLAESPKGIVARLLFELGGARQASQLSTVMGVDLVEVILNFSWVLHDPTEERDSKTEMYPMSMNVVEVVEVTTNSLNQVVDSLENVDTNNLQKNQMGDLLASLACLERRPSSWPSTDFLNFASQKTLTYPALHRWIGERCEVWDALYWAVTGERDNFEKWSKNKVSPTTSQQDSKTLSKHGVLNGYTKQEVELLSASDQAALSAVGDDKETDLEAAYTTLACSLVKRGRWEEALDICDEYPVRENLVDEIFLSWVKENEGNTLSKFTLSHEYLYRLRDPELAAELTLKHFRNWDTDIVIQALGIALRKLESATITGNGSSSVHSSRLKQELRALLDNMKTLKQVLQESNGKWTRWHEIDEQYHNFGLSKDTAVTKTTANNTTTGTTDSNVTNSDPVISHLLSLNLHDLARQIHRMYSVKNPSVHDIELSRLLYLFTKNPDAKTQAVNRLLQFPPKQTVHFAFQLLSKLDLIPHRALLCKMLLTRLQLWLSPEQVRELEILNASLVLLGAVEQNVDGQNANRAFFESENLLLDSSNSNEKSESSRLANDSNTSSDSEVGLQMLPHYLRLLHSPVLIVESLLMNARVDILKPFLRDFPQYRVDALILKYARKALSLDPNPRRKTTTDLTGNSDDDRLGAADLYSGRRSFYFDDVLEDSYRAASEKNEVDINMLNNETSQVGLLGTSTKPNIMAWPDTDSSEESSVESLSGIEPSKIEGRASSRSSKNSLVDSLLDASVPSDEDIDMDIISSDKEQQQIDIDESTLGNTPRLPNGIKTQQIAVSQQISQLMSPPPDSISDRQSESSHRSGLDRTMSHMSGNTSQVALSVNDSKTTAATKPSKKECVGVKKQPRKVLSKPTTKSDLPASNYSSASPPEKPSKKLSYDNVNDENYEDDGDLSTVSMASGLGGKWCLTNNIRDDRIIRRSHKYETAPNIKLAESILELLSDDIENANLCFDICDELSLRWQSLLPSLSTEKKMVAEEETTLFCSKTKMDNINSDSLISISTDEAGGGSDTDDLSSDNSDDSFLDSDSSDDEENVSSSNVSIVRAKETNNQKSTTEKPSLLTSVSIVDLLIKRLLAYLKIKFQRHPEFVLKVERSLSRLVDFLMMLWQTTGHVVSLNMLCDESTAAKLRDQLIAEDELDLALELCERCSYSREELDFIAKFPNRNVSGENDIVLSEVAVDSLQDLTTLHSTPRLLNGSERKIVNTHSLNPSSPISSRGSHHLIRTPITTTVNDIDRLNSTTTTQERSIQSNSIPGTVSHNHNYTPMPGTTSSFTSMLHKCMPNISSFPAGETRALVLLQLFDYENARKWIDKFCECQNFSELLEDADYDGAGIGQTPLSISKITGAIKRNLSSKPLESTLFREFALCLSLSVPGSLKHQKMNKIVNNNLTAASTTDSRREDRLRFLEKVELAIRFPPLYNLDALEVALSNFTTNALYRKLYKATSPMPPLPLFLFPDLSKHNRMNQNQTVSNDKNVFSSSSKQHQQTIYKGAGYSGEFEKVLPQATFYIPEKTSEGTYGLLNEVSEKKNSESVVVATRENTSSPSELKVASFVTQGGGPPQNRMNKFSHNNPRIDSPFLKKMLGVIYSQNQTTILNYIPKVCERLAVFYQGDPGNRNIQNLNSVTLFNAISYLYPPIHGADTEAKTWCTTSDAIARCMAEKRVQKRERQHARSIRRIQRKERRKERAYLRAQRRDMLSYGTGDESVHEPLSELGDSSSGLLLSEEQLSTSQHGPNMKSSLLSTTSTPMHRQLQQQMAQQQQDKSTTFADAISKSLSMSSTSRNSYIPGSGSSITQRSMTMSQVIKTHGSATPTPVSTSKSKSSRSRRLAADFINRAPLTEKVVREDGSNFSRRSRRGAANDLFPVPQQQGMRHRQKKIPLEESDEVTTVDNKNNIEHTSHSLPQTPSSKIPISRSILSEYGSSESESETSSDTDDSEFFESDISDDSDILAPGPELPPSFREHLDQINWMKEKVEEISSEVGDSGTTLSRLKLDGTPNPKTLVSTKPVLVQPASFKTKSGSSSDVLLKAPTNFEKENYKPILENIDLDEEDLITDSHSATATNTTSINNYEEENSFSRKLGYETPKSNWALLWSYIFTFCFKSLDLKSIQKMMVFSAKKLLLDREITDLRLNIFRDQSNTQLIKHHQMAALYLVVRKDFKILLRLQVV